MMTFAASSNGPSGSAADLTLPKYLRTIFSAASRAFATPASSFVHAFVSQPTRNGRALRSKEGEYVKAPLSMGTVLRSFGIVAGNCGENTRAVFRAARQRTDLVHGRRKRHRAVPADAPISGPQAAHAAERRRTNDRAPSFGSNGKGCEARGNNRSGAGRRPARPAFCVPRIFASHLAETQRHSGSPLLRPIRSWTLCR